MLRKYLLFLSLVILPLISFAQFKIYDNEDEFSTTNKSGGESYSFYQEEPGKILNYIPIASLTNIDSLTIVGLLDERDVKIINKMSNLKYLDLSDTFITYEPERLKRHQDSQEGLAQLGVLLGAVAEEKKKKGEIDEFSYEFNSYLADAMKETGLSKMKNVPCFMPAIISLKKLKTVKLPKTAKRIARFGFTDCTALEEVGWSEQLEEIGVACFANTKIKHIYFPPSFKKIDTDKFFPYSGMREYEPFRDFQALMFIPASEFDFSNCPKCDIGTMSYLSSTSSMRLGSKPIIPNLKVIKLSPAWKEIIIYGGDNKVTYYIPIQLDKLNVATGKQNPILHFASPLPPKKVIVSPLFTKENKLEVYIPTGSLNDYYIAMGIEDNVEFIEY